MPTNLNPSTFHFLATSNRMHVSKSWVSACTDLPIFYLISGPTPRFHARMQKIPSPSAWLWPCSRVQYLVVLAFSRKERALSTRNYLREGWHLCCSVTSGSRIRSRRGPQKFFPRFCRRSKAELGERSKPILASIQGPH